MPVSRRSGKRNWSRPRSAGGASAFIRTDRGSTERDRSDEAKRATALRIREMIDIGIRLAASDIPADVMEQELEALHRASLAATEAWLDPRHVVAEEVITMIGNRWEYGWQPADLLHYLGRRNPRVDDLGAAGVRQQLRRSGLDQRLPDDWRRQLAGLDPEPAAGSRGRAGWLFTDDDPQRAWFRALHLMYRLRQMHRLAPIGPPPSQWGHAASRPKPSSRAAGRTDDGILDRVRALLAKAESTTFPAEAEALTGKAQELITRHSIDEAALGARHPGHRYEVSARRLHLDNPYAMAKALLVQSVAEANQVRAIWDEVAGASTVVGMETDLEQVELLVSSLLVQATRAMTDAGRGTRAGSINRSPTFRRSFLTAYATRIGQRLAESAERVASEYGAELVPVLRERRQAVDEATEELFPHVSRGGSRTVDLRGWRAGTDAADQAVLPRGSLSAGGS